MNERKRIFILILIMVTVGVVAMGITVSILYKVALKDNRDRLIETAQSQARLIESVAAFDVEYSSDYPGGSYAATLSQIIDAHNNYEGYSKTGEFTLARLEGDKMVFLLNHAVHQHTDKEHLKHLKPVPFDSKLAEPMRRALSGKSGSLVGLDYKGKYVMAAHEPVAVMGLGIVAKIDLSEIRAPFIRATIIAAAVGLCIIIIGSILFLRISDPIIKRLKEYAESQEKRANELEEANRAIEETSRKFRESQAQLFQSEKMSVLGTMVAGVAHELNNPMTGILGFVKYAIKHTPGDSKVQPVLHDTMREAKRCVDIVDNLLTFSHMEKEGEEEFREEDLETIIDRVLKLLSYRIETDRVTVTLDIDADTPKVWIRPNSFQQVVLNLISNAVDALAGATKKEILIDVRPEGDHAVIKVIDTGRGIDEKDINKVFDPFYSTKAVGEGTGLGLSVCRNILEKHSAEITCASTPGVGTTFIIRIPIKKGG
ncbi:MAG: HAMP domain-containing sensor histidine kinase [Thermodesulfobacteriota bacterium]